MLTITKVNYIRELYFLEGESYTEISRKTGYNYRTIKKYIEMEDFSPDYHMAKRPNKTDILRPIIFNWLTEDKSRHPKQRHTARRIYYRLKEEHPDLLQVSERRIRDIVREEKQKVFGKDSAYLKLEHPGGEAQVDFGTFKAYEQGKLKDFYELVLSFPASNAGFAVVTRSQTREALLEGLVRIFIYLGYVPSVIWFDLMASAVLRTRDRDGRLIINEFFLRFATHYGFAINLCNPDSGHEKGNVENKVGTVRRNFFVPEPVIDDLDGYNDELLIRCRESNEEDHHIHKRPRNELFEEEKSLMVPFNTKEFDTSRYERRRVNKYGLISFEGCTYSASPSFVNEWVSVKASANKVTILTKDHRNQISTHGRLFTKGQESISYLDFIDVIKLRPRALKYTSIYSHLPGSWQDYLAGLDKDSYKEAFEALREILLEGDMDLADRVLKETLEYGTPSPGAISLTYKRLKEDKLLYDGYLALRADLPPYQVDTSQYDELIGVL